MSLGLEWTDAGDPGGSTSLPELVDGLVARAAIALGASAATYVDELLARLAEYGAARRLGYDHTTMAESMRFARRFRLRFARGYDMADGAIALLTTDDLRARPFIQPESLFLRVNLPDQVRGESESGHGTCQERPNRFFERRCGWTRASRFGTGSASLRQSPSEGRRPGVRSHDSYDLSSNQVRPRRTMSARPALLSPRRRCRGPNCVAPSAPMLHGVCWIGVSLIQPSL